MDYGYSRVSTVTQGKYGNSLLSQREELEKAGAEYIYEEKFTGTKSDRPELNKLLKVLKAGDTLIVTKLDRIARSISQGSELIEQLIARGVTVNILNLGIMDSSPASKLVRNIFLSFAEFERDMIVERTQEGKAVARTKADFKEGRPVVYSRAQVNHALELLKNNSYSQVSEMTGISISTLTRAKRKQSHKEIREET
ncbi:MAG: recombinase family protein [Lachnospiraceae bacterium]|nr:recombinase family protein [Lachnospiraceae bacterium]